MFRKSLLVFAILCAAVLIGCSTTETSNSNTASGNSNSASTTGSSNTSGSSTTASTGDKIGIADCDDFLAKYEACVSGKVPEAARAQYLAGIKQWRDSWKKLAENPQTKGTLAAACKTSREQTEASMKSFGCAW